MKWRNGKWGGYIQGDLDMWTGIVTGTKNGIDKERDFC